MSIKTAPARKVIEVQKYGEWGFIWYRHSLECGHVVHRKRIAPARVNCVECEKISLLDPYDTWDDSASKEQNAERLRVALAVRVGVPLECVEVVLSPSLEILGASIRLDPSMLRYPM